MRWMLLLCGLPFLSVQAQQVDPELATGVFHKQVVESNRGMVVTANPYATKAAAAILAQGGNAMDAAVTAQLVLSLVEPQSSGIGGGLFLLHFDEQQQRLSTIDGRETAPAAATPDWFVEQGKRLSWSQAFVGGKAVGVPGVIKALELGHQQHGHLPWAQLFQPAIDLAEQGFIVSPRLHQLLAETRHPGLSAFPSTHAYFFPTTQPLAVGTRKTNADYAAILKAIAAKGSAAFYEGDNAKAIVQAVNQASIHPGQMTLADLARYQPKARDAICMPYKVYKVCGMPPPSSGSLAVMQIMGLLEQVDLRGQTPLSEQYLHWFSQASRLAFADRERYLADPDFSKVPVAGLLAKDYLKQRASLMDARLDSATQAAGTPEGAPALVSSKALEYANTSHLSIVDAHGNAVSMTTSIENAFGSGLMVNGYLLNNQLTDFSLEPSKDGVLVANRVEAGKRPRSSMAPMMVFDHQGRLLLLAGSPGGSRIIDYVAQSLVGILEFKQTAQQAVATPHLTHRNDVLALEKGTLLTSFAGHFQERGYKVQITDLNSGLHLIERTPNGWRSGVDPRREGLAAAPLQETTKEQTP